MFETRRESGVPYNGLAGLCAVVTVTPMVVPQCDATPLGAPFPEAGRTAEVCGTRWQESYEQQHAEILQQRAPRLILFDCIGNGGLADRLTGLMTVLLLAMLTDRALAIDWPGHELALVTHRIDNSGALALARAAPEKDVRRLQWLNGNRKQLQAQVEAARGFDELWPERVLVVRSNRGFTRQLLSSPSAHLAAATAARGLTPTNAQFGCLFDFLLRPTAEALAPLTSLRAALEAAGGETAARAERAAADAVDTARAQIVRWPVVGVHVRTGDASFAPAAASATAGAASSHGAELFASHRFIFEYAQQLGASLAAERGAGGARLLLMGDSVALRAHAAGVYADIALVAENVSVGHVAKQGGTHTLRGAVGEHWLYAGCDAFVYSSHSGFPRTAAARALRDDAVHTCFHYSGPLFNKDQPSARECTGPWSVATLGERHAAGL